MAGRGFRRPCRSVEAREIIVFIFTEGIWKMNWKYNNRSRMFKHEE